MHREAPGAHAAGIVERIGERRRRAAGAELADPFHADRVRLEVGLVEHHHVDIGNVGMHRQEVFREIPVDDVPAPRIDLGCLAQRVEQQVDGNPEMVAELASLAGGRQASRGEKEFAA